MVSVDDYKKVLDCKYKDEIYSVRDNGAIMRHSRLGMRVRKYDDKWTFGNKNPNTGYMELSGERVHRIVAYAFYGEPHSNKFVVDHIDTNRCNNRPENLRWITRLDNVLKNKITQSRIIMICGSIEAFVENPSILRGHENVNKNFEWMRTVTPEEARISYEKLMKWAEEKPKHQGKQIDEWIYERNRPQISYSKPWVIARITYANDVFVHENMGSFFKEEGALKQYTLLQGKVWEGADTIDDYC